MKLIILYCGSYLSRCGESIFVTDYTALKRHVLYHPNTVGSLYRVCIIFKTLPWLVYIFLLYQVPWQHTETLGIQCCTVYWPMKIGNRLILFRLEVWDAGDSSVKRYNHVLPVRFSMVLVVQHLKLDV